MQHAARDQAGLDVAPHGQPRKKIRILKNQTALGARAGELAPNRSTARPESGESKPGDQAQQRRFAATARADEGDQFAGRKRE